MWTAELVKKLWDIAWDLWEHWNGVLHEQQNVVSSGQLHALDRKVSEAFNGLKNLLLPAHDRQLISLNIAGLLKKDQLFKEAWLFNTRTVTTY